MHVFTRALNFAPQVWQTIGPAGVVRGVDLRTVGSETTGLDDYSAYAVSLEPGRQPPAYPSDIVARGQVTS